MISTIYGLKRHIYKYQLGQHGMVPSVYNSSMAFVILSTEIVY